MIHPSEESPLRRNLGMLSILGTVFLVLLDYSVVNVALPTIATQFNATDSSIVWIVNTYQLVTFSVLLGAAFVGKYIGYSVLARLGLGIFLLASIGCALSGDLNTLIVFRALQGLGGGCVLSVNMALVKFLFPGEQLGRAVALNGTAVALGAATGPSLGSFILAVSSWQWIFWINIPVVLLVLILGWKTLPKFNFEIPPIKTFQGVCLAVLSLFSGCLAIDMLMHGEFISAGLLAGLATLSYYTLHYWQKKNDQWILAGYLMKIKSFRLPCLGCFLSFVASNLYIVAMPFVLDNLFQRTPEVIGFLITPWALGVGIVSFLMRPIMNSPYVLKIGALGMFLVTISFLGLYVTPVTSSNAVIMMFTFIGGVGFGMFQPPNNRSLMISAPKGEEGAASGFQATSRLAGQAIGAALVAGVYNFVPSPGRWSLLAAAGVAVATIYVTLRERVSSVI